MSSLGLHTKEFNHPTTDWDDKMRELGLKPPLESDETPAEDGASASHAPLAAEQRGGDAGEEEDGWDDRGGTTGRLLDFEAQLSALGGRCAALESVHGRLLNLERATEARAAATADEARAAVERVAAEADSERARLSAALAALEEAHAALADEGRAATAEVRAEIRTRLDDVISREELESSLLIAIRKLEQSLEARFATKMDREE